MNFRGAYQHTSQAQGEEQFTVRVVASPGTWSAKATMEEGNLGEGSQEDVGSTRSSGSHGAMIPLSERFKPGEYDVMVGRGKICRNHPGEKRVAHMPDGLGVDTHLYASSWLKGMHGFGIWLVPYLMNTPLQLPSSRNRQ